MKESTFKIDSKKHNSTIIIISISGEFEIDSAKELKDHFRAKLRVAPNIIIDSPENIAKRQMPELSRKPITFIDKR